MELAPHQITDRIDASAGVGLFFISFSDQPLVNKGLLKDTRYPRPPKHSWRERVRPIPTTTIGLIEELEGMYPQKCISPTETRPEADHYSGKADLVLELRNRYDAETKRDKDALPKVLR